MSVRAISGYGDKEAACFLVEIAGRRFILDMGVEAGNTPNLDGVGPIDAVLISHCHADHVGALDLIGQLGNPPAYATAATAALSKSQSKVAMLPLPLYGRAEIAGVAIETGRAAHTPGGVWLRLGGEDGVLYSADWSIEGPLYGFDAPPRARHLILDASYGDYDEALADAIPSLLAFAAKGPALLPIPPAGRGLEAALMLHEAGYRVQLCATHRTVADLLLTTDDALLLDGAKPRLAAMVAAAGALDAQSAPEGMMMAAPADASKGVAGELARRFAADGSANILITGHAATGSLARELLDKGRADFLRWNVHPRLRDIGWMIETVKPEAVLPAFAGEKKVEALRAALPAVTFKGPLLG
ncbi:MAG TPA: MBL fold metallo-hydrolase [Devosiaceae bacterium]|jgi:Cft2 family RNA processing exonuclease